MAKYNEVPTSLLHWPRIFDRCAQCEALMLLETDAECVHMAMAPVAPVVPGYAAVTFDLIHRGEG